MKTINFIILLLYCIPSFANEGMQVGNDLRGHFKNFKSNISQPMTSNSDFKTVDNSQSFNANLTCGEQTKSFLDISYSGSSDITISVKLDTNLDGVKNKSFTLTNVSGVATNGLVKCNSSTWSNCNYYSYSLNSDDLLLSSVNQFDLGGIYCINSSCGSIAASEKQNILDTIGGAIASLYQNSNSKYLITKTTNDGSHIEFYGQDYKNCQNYQEDRATGSLDTTNVIQSQSNDENSVYYTLNNSVENENTNNFDNNVDNTLEANKGVSVEGDTSDYSFTYVGKQQNTDGSWSLNNDDAKVNINWANPDIKYCEIKFLEENTVVFSDGETHHSSTGDTQTWKTKIIECTGDDYSVCPYDSSKGEMIKHPCGDIDNFAEATSIMMAVDEATDDFTCSSN